MDKRAFKYRNEKATMEVPTVMNNEIDIKPSDVLQILKRNVFEIIFSLILGIEIAILGVLYVPPKFKSAAVLDIRSSYFKNPLVSDLISETTDPGELRAQREALVRLAMDREYVELLGEKFNLFESIKGSHERLNEIEMLMDQVEYFSLGPTSFRISVITSSASVAQKMTQSLLKQVIVTVMTARYSALLQTRDAIQVQVQFLARTLTDLGHVREAEKLKSRLAEIDKNIVAVRQRFTDAHPQVVKLRNDTLSLKGALNQIPKGANIFDENDVARAFLLPKSEVPTQEIYQDLLRKLSFLNVLLTMESQNGVELPGYLSIIQKPTLPLGSFFPNPIQFLGLGMFGGIVLGLAITFVREYNREQILERDEIFKRFDLPHIGSLPTLNENKERLMLEGAFSKYLLPGPEEVGK